ncbi:MAG: helix-turn-helix transcriptional regulator [Thermoplasmata archaeon]
MDLISMLEKSIKIGVATGALIAFVSILAISYMTIIGSTAIVLYFVWYSSLLTGSVMIVLSYYTLISIHKKEQTTQTLQPPSNTREGNMEQQTISELLPENESLIYDIIMEHNGEVRQSIIINESKMSKAKVSRVLYSLEKKGLIIKIRSGMGNVIKIVQKKMKCFSFYETSFTI